MSGRFWTVAVVLAGLTPAAPAADDKAPGADVFGLTKVWQFGVEIPAKEYEAMQPAGGGGFPMFPGAPPPPAPPPKPGEPVRETHRNTFGVNFPIVHGEFAAEGATIKNVAVRYKGNFNYMMSARSLKRPLKLDLDRYDENARFHGLKNITLNAGAVDPAKGREALAYAVFREAGVSASRTAFAEVSLTVPGKYDKEYLGLYTFVEDVDRTFLKTHFKNGKGLLLKPEGVRGIEYMGEDWNVYKTRYRAKHDATEKEGRRLIDFARLVNIAEDDKFRREIGSFLDIDEFLRFVAVNALIVNLDSFFTIGHNYYLYLNPDTNKFAFIPWDLDLALCAWPAVGTPDLQMTLSLTHPHSGENKLIDRLLAMKDVNEKYQQILKELAAGAFAKERLLKDVEAIERTTKDLIAKDAKAAAARKEPPGGMPFGMPGGGQPPDLRTFVEKRTDSVAAQLAGKTKGYVPVFGGFGPPPGGPGGFGPPGGGPGGFGPPPRIGEVMPAPIQNMLRLTDEQKKKFEELQKETDAKVEKLLTEEQKAQFKRLREGGQGGFGPGGPIRP